MRKWRISDSNYVAKEPEEGRETSQAKRRRMLQFNDEDMDQSLCNMEMSSPCFKNVSVYYFFRIIFSNVYHVCWLLQYQEDNKCRFLLNGAKLQLCEYIALSKLQ